jgi:deoxycytidylate deaminase
MTSLKGPELFFGLVGAVGSRLSTITTALKHSLARLAYHLEVVRSIELLHQIEEYNKTMERTPVDQRYSTYMDAGDAFRKQMGLGDALARLSIGFIQTKRKSVTNHTESPIPRCAYVFQRLKHPHEVALLRRVYGPNFYLISAYVPKEIRRQNLITDIAASHYNSQREEYSGISSNLIERDEYDGDNEFGQRVRDTFPEADLFIDAADITSARQSIDRFIELLFNNTFHTPTKSEYAMHHAQSAAYRSAAMGRQVGATIATADGDILAVGTNEVPKFGGGLYWSDDPEDGRDHTKGHDISDTKKRELLAEVLRNFKDAGWFDSLKDKSVATLLEEAAPMLKGTRLMSLIEFGRAVHAEMAAMLDAARRGSAIKGTTLYTTTFPCHDCARHIIAAGVYRVRYIEPYPKSLAQEFHLDSIEIDPAGTVTDKVVFQPFVGVSPRIYSGLFRMTARKDKTGQVIEWQPSSDLMPRLAMTSLAYVDNESFELNELSRRIASAGLILTST